MSAAANPRGRPVAVVIGATSKWQADGRNTLLVHGQAVDEALTPVGPVGASAAPSSRNSRRRASSSS